MCSTTFPRNPSVPRHSKRRFGSPPTTRSGEDHRPPVGPGARWSHRGAIQDGLIGTRRTVRGARNGLPTLSHPQLTLLGRQSGPASPNQAPLPPDAHWWAQRELSWNNGERFLAPGFACVPLAECLRCYHDTVLPKRAHLWYKSDDGLWWLRKINASTTEDGVYLVRCLDDPGPIKLPLPPARYTTSTGGVRGSWCL